MKLSTLCCVSGLLTSNPLALMLPSRLPLMTSKPEDLLAKVGDELGLEEGDVDGDVLIASLIFVVSERRIGILMLYSPSYYDYEVSESVVSTRL